MNLKNTVKGVVFGAALGTVLVPASISLGVLIVMQAPFLPLAHAIIGGVSANLFNKEVK